MIYGSVCSGIEAPSVAWHPLGWRAAFFADNEAFPSAALAHHYPTVPNHGDMTRFAEWPDHAIDVLVGGTPCQSFSIAGGRGGLDDPRGNLMLTFGAIARRYRPRRLVWENVPGVLSSDGGRDFASLLGLLSGHRIEVPVGGWRTAGSVPGIDRAYGLAWRVLDAQFVRVDGFGRAVPQRRRRVFVVGYLGGDWRRAAAVLFERASLCGHPAPRRESGKGPAPTLAARTRGGGGLGTDFDCDGGLVANDYAATLTRGAESAGKGGYAGRRQEDDVNLVAHTLNAKGGAGRSDSESESETFLPVAHALRADGFDASEDGTGRGTPLVPTLAFNARHDPDVFHGHTGPLDTDGSTQGILASWRVRRLTPTECERLQGFPDGYTATPYRGKPAADGPRYKALGNSMAVNVMRWIGRRVEMVESIP